MSPSETLNGVVGVYLFPIIIFFSIMGRSVFYLRNVKPGFPQPIEVSHRHRLIDLLINFLFDMFMSSAYGCIMFFAAYGLSENIFLSIAASAMGGYLSVDLVIEVRGIISKKIKSYSKDE